MICFVLGKPNSGKSLRAEELAVSMADEHKVYVATMKVIDEAGRARVEKHRKQREGKGFETVELLYGLLKLPPMIEEPEKTTVLLECLSNLVGNEIYDNPKRSELRGFLKDGSAEAEKNPSAEESGEERTASVEALKASKERSFAEEITAEIRSLAEQVHCLVVVSTEYEPDSTFDEETMNYIRILNLVNEKVKAISDRMIR